MAVAVDPDEAVTALRLRFPGVQIWFGTYTRRYKALHRGELIEVLDPQQLIRQLEVGYLPPRVP